MESYIKKILNELEESQEELDEMNVTGIWMVEKDLLHLLMYSEQEEL